MTSDSPDGVVWQDPAPIHSGIVCTLLDTAAGCALLSTLARGKNIVSAEIKVSYVKAVHPYSGRLTATGTVLKSDSRVGFTEGVVTDACGAVVATASSTLLICDV